MPNTLIKTQNFLEEKEEGSPKVDLETGVKMNKFRAEDENKIYIPEITLYWCFYR